MIAQIQISLNQIDYNDVSDKLRVYFLISIRMQIFIPVTVVSKVEKQQSWSMFSEIHPQQQSQLNNLRENQNSQVQSLHSVSPYLGPFKLKEQTPPQHQQTKKHQINSSILPNNDVIEQSSPWIYNYCHNLEEQLQKKSTKSSLHQLPPLNNYQNYREHSIITENTHSQQTKTNQPQHFTHYLQTESDTLPQPVHSCKICLEETIDQSYDFINNPICKVCKCQDHAHLKCIQQWITHRDILNELIQPNQCEICLTPYLLEINIETFLSLQIFYKQFKRQPTKVICKFIPTLSFLILSFLVLYSLIILTLNHQKNGGYIRELLTMPYGTCITITVFLLLILLLISGIFLHSWIIEFCLDFRYRVQKNQNQKITEKQIK